MNPALLKNRLQRFAHPWLFFAVIASMTCAILVLSERASIIRAACLFAYLLSMPGWAFIRLLHLNDALTAWTLSIAFSLGCDALVATFMVYAGVWSLPLALGIIILITLAGSLIPQKADTL